MSGQVNTIHGQTVSGHRQLSHKIMPVRVSETLSCSAHDMKYRVRANSFGPGQGRSGQVR